MLAQEMTRLLETAKSDMVLGLKHREASLLKLKLGWYILIYLRSVFRLLLILYSICGKRKKKLAEIVLDFMFLFLQFISNHS